MYSVRFHYVIFELPKISNCKYDLTRQEIDSQIIHTFYYGQDCTKTIFSSIAEFWAVLESYPKESQRPTLFSLVPNLPFAGSK